MKYRQRYRRMKKKYKLEKNKKNGPDSNVERDIGGLDVLPNIKSNMFAAEALKLKYKKTMNYKSQQGFSNRKSEHPSGFISLRRKPGGATSVIKRFRSLGKSLKGERATTFKLQRSSSSTTREPTGEEPLLSHHSDSPQAAHLLVQTAEEGNDTPDAIKVHISGRLRWFYHERRRFTQDKLILGWILGLKIPFTHPPPSQAQFRDTKWSPQETAAIQTCINTLLSRGVINEVTPCDNQFLSNIFLREKSGGGQCIQTPMRLPANSPRKVQLRSEIKDLKKAESSYKEQLQSDTTMEDVVRFLEKTIHEKPVNT
nr:unnamed protein product [Callosobruchus chinensis]